MGDVAVVVMSGAVALVVALVAVQFVGRRETMDANGDGMVDRGELVAAAVMAVMAAEQKYEENRERYQYAFDRIEEQFDLAPSDIDEAVESTLAMLKAGVDALALMGLVENVPVEVVVVDEASAGVG